MRIQFSGKPRIERHADLRTEIMAYQDGEMTFDVFLYAKGTGPKALKEHARNEGQGSGQPAGRLVIDAPIVLSEACDKTLHFGHSPH